MGGYGSGRFGARRTVESVPSVSIHELRPQLAARPRSVSFQHHGGVQEVPLAWSACHYGGARPWFQCPCGKRAALLYLGAAGLRCRGCYGLTYAVRSEEPGDTALRQLRKLNYRLGGNGCVLGGPPSRPPGMHRDTYARLCERYQELRVAMWSAVL